MLVVRWASREAMDGALGRDELATLLMELLLHVEGPPRLLAFAVDELDDVAPAVDVDEAGGTDRSTRYGRRSRRRLTSTPSVTTSRSIRTSGGGSSAAAWCQTSSSWPELPRPRSPRRSSGHRRPRRPARRRRRPEGQDGAAPLLPHPHPHHVPGPRERRVLETLCETDPRSTVTGAADGSSVPPLPRITGREVVRALGKLGWVIVAQRAISRPAQARGARWSCHRAPSCRRDDRPWLAPIDLGSGRPNRRGVPSQFVRGWRQCVPTRSWWSPRRVEATW